MNRKVMRWTAVIVASFAFTAMASRQNEGVEMLDTVDQKQAKAIFKAMSDYLGKQDRISYEYDSNLEIVTVEDQKLGLASSGTLVLSRPDRVRATRVGGFANVELVFDGRTATLLNRENNRYAQADIPGSVENLIGELRERYKKSLPAADFLTPDFYSQLMKSVTDVKDLGSGVIRGQECDHIALRAGFVDYQIWVAQGSEPVPCRLSITSRDLKGQPQYTVDIRNFKTGSEAERADFRFSPPEGAQQVKPDELADFDELPEIFKVKTTEVSNETR